MSKFFLTNLENLRSYINIEDNRETEDELIFIGEWDIMHLIQQSIIIYDKSSGWLKSFSFNETRKESGVFEEISYEQVSDSGDQSLTEINLLLIYFPSQILIPFLIIILIRGKKTD